MIDTLKKEFDEINSNLEILPTNNAKNVEKYIEYIDTCLDKYSKMLKDAESEINIRYSDTLNKYANLTFYQQNTDINYSSFKLSDLRVPSDEKLNLPYLFYKLRHLDNKSLFEVNGIINEIIENFSSVGIKLSAKDFTISENVNIYMTALFSNSEDIQDTFNNLFWKTSNILEQIELNFRYIYEKNNSKIDEYYKKKYSNFDFLKFLNGHREIINENDKLKHSSVKYMYDLFMDGKYETDDFTSESRIQNLFNKILLNPTSDRNYECVVKLKKSLTEYKGYMEFEFLISDFKELYSHQSEYKGLYENKLKEISKKEDLIIVINKKINKTGFFKLNKKKKEAAQTERNAVITELVKDYEELDALKIKDFIFNNVTPETSIYNILVFVSYNFNYFVSLLEKNNYEMTIENIDKMLLKLQQYLYDSYIDIINNINIVEDKHIDKIIVEMYKLNGINLTEEDINIDQITKYIESVDKLIIYFDVYTVMLNLKDIDYLIKAPAVLNKK